MIIWSKKRSRTTRRKWRSRRRKGERGGQEAEGKTKARAKTYPEQLR